jgi:hypothetical protein
LNFKSIFEISEKKESLGNQFRNKRFKFFFNKIKKLKKPVTILDVGGKINYWENRNLAGNNDYQITLLNIDLEESLYSNKLKRSIRSHYHVINAIPYQLYDQNTYFHRSRIDFIFYVHTCTLLFTLIAKLGFRGNAQSTAVMLQPTYKLHTTSIL